jgi:hypothetical protein
MTPESEGSEKMINIHDRYPEFRRNDNISFPRILFGFIFLFWIRIIAMVAITVSLYLILKFWFKESVGKMGEEYRKKLKLIVSCHAGIALIIWGMRRKVVKPDVADVYRKYLGPTYDFEESTYSCIISNHVSWYDILYLLYEETPGFISKASLADVPLIGYITRRLDSLFLDRTDESNRSQVVRLII